MRSLLSQRMTPVSAAPGRFDWGRARQMKQIVPNTWRRLKIPQQFASVSDEHKRDYVTSERKDSRSAGCS